MIEKNVQLIVVDSVASLPRHEFNGSSIASRQAELTKEAQVIPTPCRYHHVFVYRFRGANVFYLREATTFDCDLLV